MCLPIAVVIETGAQKQSDASGENQPQGGFRQVFAPQETVERHHICHLKYAYAAYQNVKRREEFLS
jgi:hypothetical protein